MADIDAVSGKRETRADLIRVAIAREIERRIKAQTSTLRFFRHSLADRGARGTHFGSK